jgi:hypothetical protein
MYKPLPQYVLCRPLQIPLVVRWPVLLFGLPNKAHRAAACAPFILAEHGTPCGGLCTFHIARTRHTVRRPVHL